MKRCHMFGVALAAVLLSVAPPTGWSVASGQEGEATPLGAIEGLVFQDDNGDGKVGPEEFGLAAVPVRLRGEDFDDTTLTDDSGLFRFDELEPGEYDLMIEPGMTWSVIGRSMYTGLTIEDELLTGLDFGLQPVEAPEVELEALPTAEQPDEEAAAEPEEEAAVETPVPDLEDALNGVIGLISEPEEEELEEADEEEVAEPEAEGVEAEEVEEAEVAEPAEEEAEEAEAVTAPEEAEVEEETEPTEAEAIVEPVYAEMPPTGVADVGDASLLTIAALGLVALGGAGLAYDRRRRS